MTPFVHLSWFPPFESRGPDVRHPCDCQRGRASTVQSQADRANPTPAQWDCAKCLTTRQPFCSLSRCLIRKNFVQSNWAGVGFPRSPWLCTVDPLPRRSVTWMPYAGSPGFKWGETVIGGQKESSWCPPFCSVFMGKLKKVRITIDFSEKNK